MDPGFSLGTLSQWSHRQQPVPDRRTRQAWGITISLSWIVPDSIKQIFYSNPHQQWEHGRDARQALRLIQKDVSVSANTPLVPLIAD